ncbi:Uncharacterized protein Adt_12657 [Abeliophyllum distichum]|uniref:Putative plant transposon protein domain-containing protein n=1 Tax=Abeliophyllum distichum TaxID=126358 RepID=A0ABD1USC7_9LAMI
MAPKRKGRETAPTICGVSGKFIKERRIDFGEIKDTMFAKLFVQYGWKRYVEELSSGNPKLVQDFYNNFNADIDNEESPRAHYTKVLGKWISFSKESIDEYLGLISMDAACYKDFIPDFSDEDVIGFLFGRSATGESGPFHNGALCEMAWYLHHFVAANVEPTSNITTINIQRAQLLYTIWVRKIDLGHHIYELIRIHGIEKSSSKRVIFPCLITAICKNKGIRSFPQEETLLHNDPISTSSFRRACEQIVQKGKHMATTPPSGPGESSAHAPQPSYSPFEQRVLDMFQGLTMKVDRLQHSVDQLLAIRRGSSDPDATSQLMDDSAYPPGSF